MVMLLQTSRCWYFMSLLMIMKEGGRERERDRLRLSRRSNLLAVSAAAVAAAAIIP